MISFWVNLTKESNEKSCVTSLRSWKWVSYEQYWCQWIFLMQFIQSFLFYDDYTLKWDRIFSILLFMLKLPYVKHHSVWYMSHIKTLIRLMRYDILHVIWALNWFCQFYNIKLHLCQFYRYHLILFFTSVQKWRFHLRTLLYLKSWVATLMQNKQKTE